MRSERTSRPNIVSSKLNQAGTEAEEATDKCVKENEQVDIDNNDAEFDAKKNGLTTVEKTESLG